MYNNALFLTLASTLLSVGVALGGFQNPIVGELCIALFSLMVIVAFFQWLQLPNFFRLTADAVGSFRFGFRIPLNVAARIAYQEARLSGSIWADAAERLSSAKTPDGILDYVAHYFVGDSNIWGKRAPSTRTELIPPMLAKYGAFSGGATNLRLRDESHSVFTDLQVSRKDLRRVVKAFREGLTKDSKI